MLAHFPTKICQLNVQKNLAPLEFEIKQLFFFPLQGFSFLKRYQALRGESQEVLYNMGRALHQLGKVQVKCCICFADYNWMLFLSLG